MAGETLLTIVGNLTADPEVRTTSTGRTVASFTIASTSRTFNRNSGQNEEGQTLYMRCSAWQDLATHIAQTLSKGMRVIAQGRLSQRSYDGKDGTRHSVVELTVDEIGPSLRFASAQVERRTSSYGFNSGQQQNAGYGSSAPSGYQGGASYVPSQQPSAPKADPWNDTISDSDFDDGGAIAF